MFTATCLPKVGHPYASLYRALYIEVVRCCPTQHLIELCLFTVQGVITWLLSTIYHAHHTALTEEACPATQGTTTP